MSRTSLAGRSRLILPDLESLAIQTCLVVRKSSKFTPGGFLQSLLSGTVTGKASFNQLASELGERTGSGMSRQSLHERLGECATAFLMAVLCALMEQRFRPAVTGHKEGAIRRLLVEDASAQVMAKANSGAFPAHGNHHGPTAGVKIDFAIDLLAGTIVSHSLHHATAQDKSLGREFLAEVRRGDLVLRDMGYFSLGEFTEIEGRGAFWLTRLPLTTGVRLEDGEVLEKRLKSRRHQVLDLPAVVGEEGKKCRLVALRAAPEVAAARRAERRKKARECGKKPCPKGLVRDGWHLMLTNLKRDQAGVSKLAAIYRARWAIEIQFRAWKQALNLGRALDRKSNRHHLEALVLAGMIAHQLGMQVARSLGATVGRERLSYEKIYDLLATYLIKVRDFADVSGFDPDPRHITRDKRARQSPVQSGIAALT